MEPDEDRQRREGHSLPPLHLVDDEGRSAAPADAERDDADTIVDVAGWERYLEAYDDHAPRLYRIALLLLRGNRHDADDVLQEVFLSSYGPWLDGRVADLGPYLRRSLTNRITSGGRHRSVVDRHERRRRGDERGDVGVDVAASDHVDLQRALDSLPARQRAAVVLRYYEGLSVAETADALSVTEGTVKSQVFEALRRLRGVLEVQS